MEVHFPPETQAQLTNSAIQQGRRPDELALEIISRHFQEESRFMEAVNKGDGALARGEFLTHEEVGQRLQRYLQP